MLVELAMAIVDEETAELEVESAKLAVELAEDDATLLASMLELADIEKDDIVEVSIEEGSIELEATGVELVDIEAGVSELEAIEVVEEVTIGAIVELTAVEDAGTGEAEVETGAAEVGAAEVGAGVTELEGEAKKEISKYSLRSTRVLTSDSLRNTENLIDCEVGTDAVNLWIKVVKLL